MLINFCSLVVVRLQRLLFFFLNFVVLWSTKIKAPMKNEKKRMTIIVF